MDQERWFVVESPRSDIKAIVVGEYLGGFKIDIHGVEPNAQFEGNDTVQDSMSAVVRILRNYVGSDSQWLDCDTREPVHVWEVITALSHLER